MPTHVVANLTTFTRNGGEVIFTDIALDDLVQVFPNYVNVIGNLDWTGNVSIHNPPLTGFPAEFPSQYPTTFPQTTKIYTMGGGRIVDTILNTTEVRVLLDTSEYDGGNRTLAFYFPYGDGLVEGFAYHPQEQTEDITYDPYSYVVSSTFYGNKFIHKIPPAAYSVTINAYCYTEAADVSVSIRMDGVPTGFNTPHTFTGLTGPHTFTVPNNDPSGHPFKQWSTGQTSTTVTVSSPGIYTAYYEIPPGYSVTIDAYCYTEATSVSVGITMDGNPTGYNTPHTFFGLAGDHTFTVPTGDLGGCPFQQWSTLEMSTTITVGLEGTYTAYYGTPVSPQRYYTILAYCHIEKTYVNVAITVDGTPTRFTTPYTFTVLIGVHNFTVPSTDSNGHSFVQWGIGEYLTTLTPFLSDGTYMAQYGGAYTPPPVDTPYSGGATGGGGIPPRPW